MEGRGGESCLTEEEAWASREKVASQSAKSQGNL